MALRLGSGDEATHLRTLENNRTGDFTEDLIVRTNCCDGLQSWDVPHVIFHALMVREISILCRFSQLFDFVWFECMNTSRNFEKTCAQPKPPV